MPRADVLSVPEKTCVYAVGDVHGQIGQLRRAVDWIVSRAREDARRGVASTVVFLGDYLDRGEDSRAVIDLLSTQVDEEFLRWVFLAGNHEAAMLAFLARPEENAAWLRFGGGETLANYGVRQPMGMGARALRGCSADLAQAIPEAHLAFLRRLHPSFQCGDYLFVHAGVRPGIALDRQRLEDMLWIREAFLDHPQWHGKCVVHGHTIASQVTSLAWRIGLDTGAYAGGPLSCLALTGNGREIVGFS